MRDHAHYRARTILKEHYPTYIDNESEMILRKEFPILLPPKDHS